MLHPKKSENIEISTSAFDYQPSRISALKMTFYARVKIKNNRKDKNNQRIKRKIFYRDYQISCNSFDAFKLWLIIRGSLLL